MKNSFLIVLIIATLWFDAKLVAGQAEKLKLVVDAGHSDSINALAFSPQGDIIASGSGILDKTIKLWDVKTGQELRTLAGNSASINSVAFSPDGKVLASGGDDNAIKLWNVETGNEIRSLLGHSGSVYSVAFSPDGKTLASGSWDQTVKLWKVDTGKELKTLGHSNRVWSVAFSPDGKTLASGSYQVVKLWDLATTLEIKSFAGNAEFAFSVAFSPDGKILVSGSGRNLNNALTSNESGEIILWNVDTGKEVRTLRGHSRLVRSISLSSDGKTLATGSYDRTIKLWSLDTGRELRTLTGHRGYVLSVIFSPDGKTLASGDLDGVTKLCEAETGKDLRTLVGHSSFVRSIAFSPDGRTLATGGDGKTGQLWDFVNGQVRPLTGPSGRVNALAFSPDGKTLVSAGNDMLIRLWNVATGEELLKLDDNGASVDSVRFSPSGKVVASQNVIGGTKLWDVETGKRIVFDKLPEWVRFENPEKITGIINGRMLSAERDGATIKLYSQQPRTTLLSLFMIGERNWAVVTPDGRFDASEGAQRLMHYSYGLEVISLEQLKEMYYEPGLLQKLLSFSKESLRPIVPLTEIKLYPEIVEQRFNPSTGRLTVKLNNRGGGVGKTEVHINGKLTVADARNEKLRRNPDVVPQGLVNLTVGLPQSAFLKGRENQIKVITSNYVKEIGRGNIRSRGNEIVHLEKGSEEFRLPVLYAIVGGVSDYDGSSLDLKFAAKDAEDFAGALQLGARRLFCPRTNPNCLDRVQITTLSTSGRDGTIRPSKENFTRVFADVAAKATPDDILVIYLAGHGVSFGTGTDSYFYLTQEARSKSFEGLAQVFSTSAISSEELTEWLTTREWTKGQRGIRALKQVLILDTCSSGNAAEKLTLSARRNLSGDQIRAIEFLKDKTGTFVLMGSTSDTPSYEASQYGQGLLTYSLLQAMKGAALDKGEFVDVQTLFSYAQIQVPRLAANIGGIQRPIVSAPLGKTFIIGQMTDMEKQGVVLSSTRPLMLRPLLTSPPIGNDPLKLIPELRKQLDAESSYEVTQRRGKDTSILVYVDDDSFPGAVSITGQYTVEGGRVRVKAFLLRDEKIIAALPEVFADKDGVIEELLKSIRFELGKIH